MEPPQIIMYKSSSSATEPWPSISHIPHHKDELTNNTVSIATIINSMTGGPDDVESWIATLRSGECLSERSLRKLCQLSSEILMEESNVQPVLSPVTIVGDLHGQFYDLLQLLSPEVGGEPPDSSYGECSCLYY